MDTYVVFAKYAARETVSIEKAVEMIRSLAGVCVQNVSESGIAKIQATKSGIREVKKLLSRDYHIQEPVMLSPQVHNG